MHRTGDRFTPEGEWKGVGSVVDTRLRADIEALAAAYLSATPLPSTSAVYVPDSLRAPSSDHGGFEYETGSLALTMERLDPQDGLLDVLGTAEAAGVVTGPLSFMLTLEPLSEGVYRLWSVPTLVP